MTYDIPDPSPGLWLHEIDAAWKTAKLMSIAQQPNAHVRFSTDHINDAWRYTLRHVTNADLMRTKHEHEGVTIRRHISETEPTTSTTRPLSSPTPIVGRPLDGTTNSH